MKVLGLLHNLIHSTTLKLEKSEQLHTFYLNNDEIIKLPYSVSYSIGHIPKTELEKELFKFLESWISSGFKHDLNINSSEIKELFKKHKVETSEILGVSGMFEELVKYKNKILLSVC